MHALTLRLFFSTGDDLSATDAARDEAGRVVRANFRHDGDVRVTLEQDETVGKPCTISFGNRRVTLMRQRSLWGDANGVTSTEPHQTNR